MNLSSAYDTFNKNQDNGESLNNTQWIDSLFPSIGFREDESTDSFDLRNEQEITNKLSDSSFIKNLKESFELVVKFYGFEFNKDKPLKVGKSSQQEQRFNLYFKNNRGGKNYKRITRILFCLGIFGQKELFRIWKLTIFNYLTFGRTSTKPLGEKGDEFSYLSLWRMARCFEQNKSDLVYTESSIIDISKKYDKIRDFVFQIRDVEDKSIQVKLNDTESFLSVVTRNQTFLISPKTTYVFYAIEGIDKVVSLSNLYWHITFEPKSWFEKEEGFNLILSASFIIKTLETSEIDGSLYLSYSLSTVLKIENGKPIFQAGTPVTVPKRKPVVPPTIKVGPKFIENTPADLQTIKQFPVSFLVPLYS